jgi:hypothetical protein
MLEYASIDDLAEDYEFFGMGELFTKEMLMEGGVATAAGAGGILITQNVLDRVEYFADKPGWRAAVELAIGLAGGRALYNYNRPAAYGLLGGVGGLALATLAQQGLARAQAYMEESTEAAPTEEGAPTAGLRGARGRRGLASAAVTTVPPYIDRYKVSVPSSFRGTRALAGERVTRADYFQTRGVGDAGPQVDEEAEAEGEMPEIGTWLMGASGF